MKILMINVVCGIRSTGRICTDLAVELEKNGHEVKIAYGRGKVPNKFEKYAVHIGNDLDVLCHGLRARLVDDAGFGSKRVTRKFIEWIKRYEPDIIHLHNIHGYYVNVEMLFEYLRSCGKKIIWTLHDCWAFTGHTAYCDSVNCNRWIDGCYECPLKGEYPKTVIGKSKENWERKKMIFTDISNMTIITPSLWLASWTKKSFLSGYKVDVINNGIDTDLFTPTKSDFRKRYALEGKFVLLGVATTWDKMKGLNDFIELSEILGKQYQVVLVGVNKKQLKKLPDDILGIERTASVIELAEIYSGADIFLNLSYCENYPTVNIEALACGVPVITYDTGGSPEIIRENGYVVRKGDIKSVAKVINNVREHRTIKVEIIREEYDNSTLTQKYIKEYIS